MENLNILQIQQLIDEDKLSSVQLTEYYINRIKKYDDKYNSVFELNEDAVILAKELDEERKVSGRRSLLHGIPVLIKDNINVGITFTSLSFTEDKLLSYAYAYECACNKRRNPEYLNCLK